MTNVLQFGDVSPMQTTMATMSGYNPVDLQSPSFHQQQTQQQQQQQQQHVTFGSGHSANQGGQPQYLPEYLLGDPSYATSATSPMHGHRLWSSVTGDPYNAQRSGLQSTTKQGSHSSPNTSSRLNASSSSMAAEKQLGGPPTQGLFTSSGASSPNVSLSFLNKSTSFAQTPYSGADLEIVDASGNRSLTNVSSLSPAQMDPFYSQGESLKVDDEFDGTWVTVFGFPPSAAAFILQQFSQYGNVLEHKISGGENWIHLHYQSRIQARKALGKNGKIFGGNMMVGVAQCIDKTLMNDSTKENVSFANSPLSFRIRKPEDQSGAGSASSSVGKSGRRISGMRPLAEAYSAAASEYSVVKGKCTPQKKEGVVNKAMEYVFGW